MVKRGHIQKSVTYLPQNLEVTLDNGTVVSITTHNNRLHIAFSFIDVETPIKIKNQYANGVDIVYKPKEG
jgi:hypothetical protein